jgi:hypothetical protein
LAGQKAVGQINLALIVEKVMDIRLFVKFKKQLYFLLKLTKYG